MAIPLKRILLVLADAAGWLYCFTTDRNSHALILRICFILYRSFPLIGVTEFPLEINVTS